MLQMSTIENKFLWGVGNNCSSNMSIVVFTVTGKLISAFVFITQIVQFLYFLNPKFQAPNHLLLPYSLVCVGPGQKPRRPVFSQLGSFIPSLIRLLEIIGILFHTTGEWPYKDRPDRRI